MRSSHLLGSFSSGPLGKPFSFLIEGSLFQKKMKHFSRGMWGGPGADLRKAARTRVSLLLCVYLGDPINLIRIIHIYTWRAGQKERELFRYHIWMTGRLFCFRDLMYQTEMENIGREEMFLKGCGWEYCLIQRAVYVWLNIGSRYNRVGLQQSFRYVYNE